MFKSKEVTTTERIRSFQRSDKANKQCANCCEMGPVYVCMDFHTFVCTECSGIHRELNHKVKSISMSNWSEIECQLLEKVGGNAQDHKFYLATHDPHIYPIPSSTKKDKLKEFIRLKYVEKRWIKGVEKQIPYVASSIVVDSPRNDKVSKKDKKEKKVNDVHFADDDNLLVIGNPVEEITHVLASSPEDEIHMHFSKGIELLEKLYATNPILAQSITKTVEVSMTQQFLMSRHSTPIPQSVQSSNPFDFLTAPVLTTRAVSAHAVAPTAPTTQANPFDFFH